MRFPVIPIPNEGDWLSIHKEDGETVSSFCYDKTMSNYRIIYTQSIGSFTTRSPYVIFPAIFSLIVN